MPRPWPSETALKGLLRKGHSLTDLSRMYGIAPSAAHARLVKADLNTPPVGELRIGDAAARLGISRQAVRQSLKALGMPTRRWGGLHTITEADLAILQARRPRVALSVQQRPDGYLTVQEFARQLGVSQSCAYLRVTQAGLKPHCYLRQADATPVALYSNRDLDPLRPTPSRPVFLPDGYLRSQEVADLVGVSKAAVVRWSARGAPHVLATAQGGMLGFHPARLAAWLERQPQERTRRKARYLRALLERAA